jgi:hypothetical protein
LSGARKIPEDLVDFLESGISILVGTRDREMRPDAMRAVGARVSPGRDRITVFLPDASAERAAENLRDNGQIAVAFSRPIDHYSIQIKGRVEDLRPAEDADRVVPDRYHAAYVEQLYMVGLPRSLSQRMIVWPSLAVTFSVDDLFVQTPGPDAGKRLEPR